MSKTPKITHFGALVGSSPAMKRLYRLIRKAAGVDLPVLICGQTGTGKDLIASEIHQRSARADGPFVAVNTGILTRELMVSELFGHIKGAFTGAADTKVGRFAEADGGTLFLDEISTADDGVQVALLRVLDQGAFRPIGAKRDKRVNVRVVAATNANLRRAAQRSRFRPDLLHRFEVLRINVPPLGKRARDIGELAYHFLEQVNREFGFNVDHLSKDALEVLQAYPWPGNVRELKNVIAHAVVVAERGTLGSHDLPERVRQPARPETEIAVATTSKDPAQVQTGAPGAPRPAADFAAGDEGNVIPVPLGLPLDELQKLYVTRTLAACGNNKARTARLLGISRKTLYDQLRRWGVT